MPYLISIAIGPVQEFIASARRSRDLWLGSWLLSELSKAAAKAIVEQNGKLIFPSASPADLTPDSPFSVVNKIVAEIEAPATEDLEKLLDETVYCAMRKRLQDLRDEALSEARAHKISGQPALNWASAKTQIYDLIEYYWAALPFNDPKQYVQVRRRVEALLVARKTTRNFSAATAWSENLPKSSLDGLRESVILEAAYPNRNDSSATRKNKIRRLKWLFGAREGERLCGVSLLKRLGNRGALDSFYSTSHVAALPLLNQVTAKDKAVVRAKAEAYVNELSGLLGIDDGLSTSEREKRIKRELGHVPRGATLKPHEHYCNQAGTVFYDGRLLFEDRMREFWPDEQDKFARDEAKRKLKQFFKDVLGKEDICPLPYYAILHADGDHMGRVIEALARQGVEKHRDLSAALSRFAGRVKEIVEVEHDGSCIYAGGDDALALAPLHRALDCARALAEEFRARMEDSGLFAGGQIKAPTLSVGLAVGHHLDPLQDTLELAREAEKIAKTRIADKNALAVTVSKRSGIDRTVKGSWREDAPGGSLYQRLNYFIYLHLSDELPDAAAYDLQDVASRLKPPADATDEETQTLFRAQCAEAKRILKRKQSHHGKQMELADEVYETLRGLIEDHKLPLDKLAEEIIVARLFAQALEQSGIEKEAKEKLADWADKHDIKLSAPAPSEPPGEAPIQKNGEVDKP